MSLNFVGWLKLAVLHRPNYEPQISFPFSVFLVNFFIILDSGNIKLHYFNQHFNSSKFFLIFSYVKFQV